MPALLLLLMGIGCSETSSVDENVLSAEDRNRFELIENQIDAYQEALLTTDSSEEEADLVLALYNISHDNDDVTMTVEASGSAVTIEFLSPAWSKIVGWSAIDTNNIDILLQ